MFLMQFNFPMPSALVFWTTVPIRRRLRLTKHLDISTHLRVVAKADAI
jgi:hypothetical protein